MKVLRNVFPLTNSSKLGLGLLAVVLIVGFLCWPRASKETLVITYGERYRIASYTASKAILDDGAIDAYLLTITYQDPSRGTTRTTINVPASAMVMDPTLPARTVSWENPQLEDFNYLVARWNPGYKVPSLDPPSLVPERPLTRKVD